MFANTTRTETSVVVDSCHRGRVTAVSEWVESGCVCRMGSAEDAVRVPTLLFRSPLADFSLSGWWCQHAPERQLFVAAHSIYGSRGVCEAVKRSVVVASGDDGGDAAFLKLGCRSLVKAGEYCPEAVLTHRIIDGSLLFLVTNQAFPPPS
jgi:hypothetical protein